MLDTITIFIVIFIIAVVFNLIIIAITCGMVMKKKIDKNHCPCYNNNVERHNKQKEE